MYRTEKIWKESKIVVVVPKLRKMGGVKFCSRVTECSGVKKVINVMQHWEYTRNVHFETTELCTLKF